MPYFSPSNIAHAVVEELTRFDGVALAVSSSALSVGRVPDTPLIQSILRNYNPNRSGDIYVVFQPNRFINDFDGLIVASSLPAARRVSSTESNTRMRTIKVKNAMPMPISKWRPI